MQREFLQYAKKSLEKDGVDFSFRYVPRNGDGRILMQHIYISGITKDLQEKGYYLTLNGNDNGERELCQPPYHSLGYGNIPGQQFPWIKEYQSKEIYKEVDTVLFMELRSENRSFDIFTHKNDIQDGDTIVYSCKDSEQIIKRKITSINGIIHEDSLKSQYLLIVSITPL